ncbi:MAG: hypothetical protein ABJF86_12220 [Tateyamaria sp.]|uniref:hypothetical protein n=1 Tax=Tateyamaria sp. TaxID=1929288 RepID=UPI003291497C
MRNTSFIQDFGLLLCQLAFIPLSIITLIPESRFELANLGMDLMTSSALWSALIVSGFFTLAAKNMPEPGPLASAGVIFLVICFCLTIPLTLGFAAMTLVTVAVGGPGVLLVLWKGILFFGFVWIWFHSD